MHTHLHAACVACDALTVCFFVLARRCLYCFRLLSILFVQRDRRSLVYNNRIRFVSAHRLLVPMADLISEDIH